MRKLVLGTLLGSMMVLAATESADAQIFFGRGRGSSWGISTPYFSYGRGYYSPYYGSGWYGRRGWDGWGWGGRSYYLSAGSPYYSSYYTPYSSSYYYPYSSLYSYPYSSSYYTPYYSSSLYTPSYRSSYYGRSTSMYTPSAPADRAMIEVAVPRSDAKVWFEDHLTQQTGFQRTYESPPLGSDKNYSYTIRAAWTEDGREMTATKEVSVAPGRTAAVAFTSDDAKDTTRIPVPPEPKDDSERDPKRDPNMDRERDRELPPQSQ